MERTINGRREDGARAVQGRRLQSDYRKSAELVKISGAKIE
jgi:hypothetical protein